MNFNFGDRVIWEDKDFIWGGRHVTGMVVKESSDTFLGNPLVYIIPDTHLFGTPTRTCTVGDTTYTDLYLLEKSHLSLLDEQAQQEYETRKKKEQEQRILNKIKQLDAKYDWKKRNVKLHTPR